MDKILDNRKYKVCDILKTEIKNNSKLSVISAYFTIFAFDKLKDQLRKIDKFRFLFVEPTFTKENEEKREFYINKLDREKQLSGTEFEIKLRNELTQSNIARECADWIEEKAEFKSLKKTDTSRARAIHAKKEDDDEFIIQGTMDFTSTGLGFSNSPKIEMNMYSEDKVATKEMLAWFDEIWENDSLVEDVKESVIKNIKNIYKENTPESLYFIALYNIFREFIEEMGEDNTIKTRTGFKDTLVWNKLYKFQKDGVTGAIGKLEKHNGCIIADSVGLGKTFEALAVIKYYELRNYRVLVLAPKKLRDNWSMFRANDIRNVLSADRFGYDILNHTDLSRDKGMSGDINLQTVNWGNYDLVVIDESHNFRNNDVRKEKQTRYQKLMDSIIKSGVKTKVLMLSATPVNNKMNDLKNQVYFITEGDDSGLADHGVQHIGNTLKRTQYIFNKWLEQPTEDRKLESLLSKLNVDYFKLLDALTIARSRKHIEKYYDIEEVGGFPDRMKPKNIKSDIDLSEEFPGLKEINSSIASLKLSLYSPLDYVLPHKIKEYEDKYNQTVKDGKSIFRQSDREKSLIHLMRVNLLKRLESSIFSFNISLNNLLGKMDNLLEKIENVEKNGVYEIESTDSDDELYEDDKQLEDTMIGNAIQINLKDTDTARWKIDLERDRNILLDLIAESKVITASRDAKLADLKEVIQNKLENPINNNNKKVVVFSAFADTAEYLYKHISNWAKKEHNIHSALVTGGGSNKITSNKIPTDLNALLTNFSPVSKEKDKIFPDIKDEIDILIATDCVSEGQNLQDCDFMINYDIHWNPVRIIQRFGRIDRIGSKNDQIQLVNFWPNLELDEYIRLESRVRGRMVLLNTSATGEEDIINETDQDVMNDIEYRKNQLVKLQEDVLDLEDISGNISITDLTMNDFKMDLVEYMSENKDVLEKSPLGMYALVDIADSDFGNIKPGVIFTLKQASFSDAESKEVNALHPYYLVYIQDDGTIKYGYLQAKYILDIYRKLCKGQNEVLHDLVEVFNNETKDVKDMKKYSGLLKEAIANIIGRKQDEGLDTMFKLGKTEIAKDEKLSGMDDFELISFLILK